MDQEKTFAKVHIISVVPQEYQDLDATDEEIITNSPLPPDAEIGDLIVEKNMAGYRTDGVYIVDHNKKIIEPDDYGTLPKEFRIREQEKKLTVTIGMNHCDCEAGWHNNMVYFDPSDFKLYFNREDVFKADIFGSKNYAVSLDIKDQTYYFSQEDDLSKREFLSRMNTPGYIEMNTDDARKKYRSNVVFRIH